MTHITGDRRFGKHGEQPAKELLRAQGWSVARAALQIGCTQAHLHGVIHGHIRPNDEVRRRLPELLGKPLAEILSSSALDAAFGSGKGARRPVEVTLLRDDERIDGEDVVGQVVKLSRPPVRGESITRSDGEWIVTDSELSGGRYTVKLRRPFEHERTW